MTLLVEERGLDITGFSDFSTVLLDCNNYKLSGYFRAFQIDPSHGNNRFRNGTHIKDFMIPYLMDEQLRLLILRGTSSFEQTLRAHFAYYLAQMEVPTPTLISVHIKQSNILTAPKPEKL